MDTFYSILDEEESKQIWDRINAELRFQPSVRVNQLPFQLSAPYLVLDLTYATQEQVEKLLAEVPGALAACLGEDVGFTPWTGITATSATTPACPSPNTATGWRTRATWAGATTPISRTSTPMAITTFFVQRDLKWGWLGHPWRREIWIFGAPLLHALSPRLEELGFPVKAV